MGIDSSRVAEVFAAHAATTPGFAGAVFEHGRIAAADARGLADVRSGSSLAVASRFDICSLAKGFTALAVHMLAASGTLALTQPACAYIPELAPVARDVAVGDLLANTSGIRDIAALCYLQGNAGVALSRQDALALLGRQRALDFPPRAAFRYSHSDYFLLSEIVSRCTGRSFREFCHEEILAPLGMQHSSVDPPQDAPGVGHARGPSGYHACDRRYALPGNGAFFSCVGDLARWDRFLRTGEGIADSGDFVSGLSSSGPLHSGARPLFGNGFVLSSCVSPSWRGNGGAWDGYSSALIQSLRGPLSACVLANSGAVDAFAIAARLLAAAAGPSGDMGDVSLSRGPTVDAGGVRQPGSPPHASPDPGDVDPSDWSGLYACADLGVAYSLHMRGNRRVVGIHRDGADVMFATLDRAHVRFVKRDGRPARLVVSAPKAQGLLFDRVA